MECWPESPGIQRKRVVEIGSIVRTNCHGLASLLCTQLILLEKPTVGKRDRQL